MSVENSRDPNSVVAQISDQELLQRMFSAENGRKALALWEDDVEYLFSEEGLKSIGDMQLAMMEFLAFWTAEDRERMKRLYKQSAISAYQIGGFHDAGLLVKRALELRSDDRSVYTPAQGN